MSEIEIDTGIAAEMDNYDMNSHNSEDDDTIMSLDNEELVQKLAMSTNIASAIMLRIPTHCLPRLRQSFEDEEGELNLTQYLQVFIRNMDFESDEALFAIIPDLVDLFNQVDINGDGHMEWSEFVMFVIEQVTMETSYEVHEVLEALSSQNFPTIVTNHITCSKVLDDIKRSLVCVGDEIYIYNVDKSNPTYLALNGTIKLNQAIDKPPPKKLDNILSLQSINNKISTNNNYNDKDNKKHAASVLNIKSQEPPTIVQRPSKRELSLTAIDMAFLSSKDYLFILRNDFAIEILKFSSRSKFTSENMMLLAMEKLSVSYIKIALRDIPATDCFTGIAQGPYQGPYMIFALGSTNQIDYWELEIKKNGDVTFKNPQSLCHHKDYVRDMIVIHNDSHKYFVTCSLDKTVILYDLQSLKIKGIRTGHVMGVQCLAYDNKSTLLAGGYDYSIIGWDLEAGINRPIFHLVGHENVIMKVVALGDATKCFSMDQDGIIKYWDTSKTCPYDKEVRNIDTMKVEHDRIRNFDVIQRVSNDVNVTHNCIVTSHGRTQHTHHVVDSTVLESPPIQVLYSHVLFLIISIHMRDIVFWNVINGCESKRLTSIVDANSELLCATLDDRERKLITGDSLGQIIVYNCLTGIALKTFPIIPYAVRQLIYSDDKTIIALAGQSDIFIFDELSNDADAEVNLRDVRGLDVDVIAMAYYYQLGIIAVADVAGSIMIYNYCDLAIIMIIKNVVKGDVDIGQIAFLEPLPLLLVTDSTNSFTIIPVGPAALYFGKRLWRVDSIVAFNESSIETPTSSKLGEEHDIDNDNITTASKLLQVIPFSNKKKQEYLLSKREVKCIAIDIASQHHLQHQNKHVIWEDEPDESILDRINKLLEEVETITKAREKRQGPTTDNASSSVYKPAVIDIANIDLPLSLMQGPISPFSRSNSVMNTTRRSSRIYENMPLSRPITRPNSASNKSQKRRLPRFPSNMTAHIICGYDDGTVSITDLTTALSHINVGPLLSKDYVNTKSNYDPRKIIQRQIKDADIVIAIEAWENQGTMPLAPEKFLHPSLGSISNDSSIDSYCRGRLLDVWQAHYASIPSMKFFGDSKDILSIGDDRSMKLWTMKGEAKAILTRGRELDKIFKPRWISPIDYPARAKHRVREARFLADKLNLRRHQLPPEPRKKMELTAEELEDDISAAVASVEEGRLSFTSSKACKSIPLPEIVETQSEATSNYAMMRKSSEQSLISCSLDSYASSTTTRTETDRSRVIGQLYGRKTYLQTKREWALEHLLDKYSKRLKAIEALRNPFAKLLKSTMTRSKEDRYLDAVMGDNHSVHTTASNSVTSGDRPNAGYSIASSQVFIRRKIKQHHYESEIEHKIKDKFDIELERIDAQDPNNWDINSINRQRQLYEYYYREIEKYLKQQCSAAVMAERLNMLSPNGDFSELVNTIKQKRFHMKHLMLRKNRRSLLADRSKAMISSDADVQPLGFNITTTAKTVIIDADGHSTLIGKGMVLVPIKADAPASTFNHHSTTATNNILDLPSTSTQQYAKLLPLPINKIHANSEEMNQERMERQKLLEAFDRDIKLTERCVRQARKQRKKEKRRYRIQMKQIKLLEPVPDDHHLCHDNIYLPATDGLQHVELRKMIRHAAANIKLAQASKPSSKSNNRDDIAEAFNHDLVKIESDLSRKLMIVQEQIESVAHKYND